MSAAKWVKAINQSLGVHDGELDLHYNTLDGDSRLSVSRQVADLPIMGFVVLSHKENMRQHRNDRAAKAGGRNVFYNFCLRVLLERVTMQVAHSSFKRFGNVRSLKVIVAETGGVNYEHTSEYIAKLRAQALTGKTFLKAMTINPQVAGSWQIEQVSARTTAGCQLADVLASSFYNALNEYSPMPRYEAPSQALAKILPRRQDARAGHGLTLMPWDQNIPERYRSFFMQYGYRWSR